MLSCGPVAEEEEQEEQEVAVVVFTRADREGLGSAQDATQTRMGVLALLVNQLQTTTEDPPNGHQAQHRPKPRGGGGGEEGSERRE